MKLFNRPLIYVQVLPDHFKARVVGGERTVRRDCHALDNRSRPIADFDKVRVVLRDIFKELAPGFSLRKPWALLHFVPELYVPTQAELKCFKKTAERSGVSFCWISKWETPHTDKELLSVFSAA